MAAIAPMAPLKPEILVKAEEIKLDAQDSIVEIQRHAKKPPTKPVDPVVTIPRGEVPHRPVPAPKDPIVTIPRGEVPHPILPSGQVLEDVITHMQCQTWFTQSVRELVEQFKILKADNERQDSEIKRLRRENSKLSDALAETVQERDQWEADYNDEVKAHALTKEKLDRVRRELVDLQIKYDLIVSELKQARQALSEANREIRKLRSDIEYKNERIRDLEEKLRISNDSEDKANEKVTELQKYIYHLEQKNSAIEKEKDSYGKRTRELEDERKDLKKIIDDLRNRQFRTFEGEGKSGVKSEPKMNGY